MSHNCANSLKLDQLYFYEENVGFESNELNDSHQRFVCALFLLVNNSSCIITQDSDNPCRFAKLMS